MSLWDEFLAQDKGTDVLELHVRYMEWLKRELKAERKRAAHNDDVLHKIGVELMKARS